MRPCIKDVRLFYLPERLLFMLYQTLDKILKLDKIGLLAFIIAGLITYGSNFIVNKILDIPATKAFKPTIIIKIIGLIIGLFGLFRIMKTR